MSNVSVEVSKTETEENRELPAPDEKDDGGGTTVTNSTLTDPLITKNETGNDSKEQVQGNGSFTATS